MFMDFNQIQELIKLISETGLSEFHLEKEEFKLTIRSKEPETITETKIVSMPASMPSYPAPQYAAPQYAPPAPAAAPQNAASSAPAAEKKEVNDDKYIHITSPIVGTFYRSPSPDKPVYVNIGDTVKSDTVVCIVEAMKLFNEIESEVTGTIVKVLVDDATPVEFGQALYLVDPS